VVIEPGFDFSPKPISHFSHWLISPRIQWHPKSEILFQFRVGSAEVPGTCEDQSMLAANIHRNVTLIVAVVGSLAMLAVDIIWSG
jgi:hypothetical protein